MNQGLPPANAPGAYDPDGHAYNPARTEPFPWPSVNPRAVWYQMPHPLRFGVGVGEILFTARWQSPVFDLRPALRGVTPGAPVNVQPIWLPQGAGGTLFVQTTLDLINTPGMNVVAVESAHPSDPQRLATITGDQDITAAWTARKAAALEVFRAPGDGYPVRFWQLEIRWELAENPGALPTMSLEASYY